MAGSAQLGSKNAFSLAMAEDETMHRIGQAHIPGYTGYLPGKKEQVGLSFSEASRGILEDLDSMEEFHPVMPLVGERPNSVSMFKTHLGASSARALACARRGGGGVWKGRAPTSPPLLPSDSSHPTLALSGVHGAH